ncbi:MAG: DUF4097 family beta strand repeat-containing protein [Candidatus Wallbacteria bacterium]|nr:DUF4097 family beta strand repeat-containing protein [Candidatus Wallbacteria bacterium]
MKKVMLILAILIIALAIGFIASSSNSNSSGNSGVEAPGSSGTPGELNQEQSTAAEGVDELTITTVSSNLIIIPVETSEIRAVFSGKSGISIPAGKAPSLELEKAGNKVQIRLKYPGNTEVSFFSINFDSRLEIYLPDRSFAKITADTVSGNIECPRIAARNLSMTTVSGGMNLGLIVAENARFSTNSGDLLFTRISAVTTNSSSISGRLRFDELLSDESSLTTTSGQIGISQFKGKLGLKTVSGDADLTLTGGSVEISCEAVSGSLKLAFSNPAGFKADLSSMSGEITCGFELTDEKKDLKELTGSFGDGSGTVKMKTVSGNILLKNTKN